jgi:hypothetical protein
MAYTLKKLQLLKFSVHNKTTLERNHSALSYLEFLQLHRDLHSGIFEGKRSRDGYVMMGEVFAYMVHGLQQFDSSLSSVKNLKVSYYASATCD